MPDQLKQRRDFLKLSAIGVAGVITGMPLVASKKGSQRENSSSRGSTQAIKLGVASYSLRHFNRTEAISIIKNLDTPYVNIKSFHLPYKYKVEELLSPRRNHFWEHYAERRIQDNDRWQMAVKWKVRQ